MEKYSQYRDKGSGIAPFFPIPAPPAGAYLPVYIFLLFIRIPILLFVSVAYFSFFCWLPIGSLGKKASLWLILGTPGIWWVDIQIDGIKKGTLSRHTSNSPHIPHPGSIIVSSLTSPIDALYLAAIFDPIFTIAYPNSQLVAPCTLLTAILHPLSFASLFLTPPADMPKEQLTTLAALQKAKPDRIIVVFPECTPSNGRAILPLSPALTTAPNNTKLFPVSLRYTPADITTPVPGFKYALRFFWNLCSRPAKTIRVRIAEPVYRGTARPAVSAKPISVPNTYATNFLDSLDKGVWRSSAEVEGEKKRAENGEIDLSAEEKTLLDKVGEALARIGRVKRVALGVKEKAEFVDVWLNGRTAAKRR